MMTYNNSQVRSALIEAADVELRLRGPRGPTGPRSAWPTHRREHEDVAGYFVDDDIAETVVPVTAADRRHHATVTGWLGLISNIGDRRLIWHWATAVATGSWRGWLHENKRDVTETNRRVDTILAGLVAKLNRTIPGVTPLQTPRGVVQNPNCA